MTSDPPPDGSTLVFCAPQHSGRWYAIYEHGANETRVLLPRGMRPPKTWTNATTAEAQDRTN